MLKKGQIAQLAGLSKIAISDVEIGKMEKDMESIIELMDSIHDINAEEGENNPQTVSLSSLREDVVERDVKPEDIRPSDGFTIPKLMEQ